MGVIVLDRAISGLRFLSRSRRAYRPLPDWAQFATALGYSIASLPSDFGQTLTAIAIPSRGFSSVLAATGFILGRTQHTDGEQSIEDHIDSLRSLQPGTTVWINQSATRMEGRFDGIIRTPDQELISITTKRGRKTIIRNLPFSMAQQVQIAERQRDIRQSQIKPDLVGHSRMDVVIVGQKSSLEAELSTPEFAIAANNGLRRVRLQDIVQARQLRPQGHSSGFHSSIESPSDAGTSLLPTPQVTIFDGDRSFSRARMKNTSVGHWIVFLERTSRGFAECCATIDDHYLFRNGLVDTSLLPKVPSGLEMVSIIRNGQS